MEDNVSLKNTLKFKIERYLQLYLSSFYKRDNKIFVFGAWFGEKYDDNSKYLYEYVVKNCPEIKAVWITKKEEIYFSLKEKNYPVCLSNSLEAIELCKKANYVITVTGISDIGEKNLNYLGGAYYINLWHGVPLKKIMYDDEYSYNRNSLKEKLRNFLRRIPYRNEYIISTSETISKIYQSAFNLDKKHILQLGQPRNDYFYTSHTNKYNIKFENKKIILYMPTHRNEGKKIINLEEILNLNDLNKFCKKNNVIFLIKKHFYHSKEKSINFKYSNVFDITNEVTHSQELLDAADILITDYSSCYIDYLLLDRPIIFYNFDIEEYKKNDRQLYFEYDKVTPGKKCITYTELKNELDSLLNLKDLYLNKRKEARDLFYNQSCQSCVSDKIIKELKKL